MENKNVRFIGAIRDTKTDKIYMKGYRLHELGIHGCESGYTR